MWNICRNRWKASYAVEGARETWMPEPVVWTYQIDPPRRQPTPQGQTHRWLGHTIWFCTWNLPLCVSCFSFPNNRACYVCIWWALVKSPLVSIVIVMFGCFLYSTHSRNRSVSTQVSFSFPRTPSECSSLSQVGPWWSLMTSQDRIRRIRHNTGIEYAMVRQYIWLLVNGYWYQWMNQATLSLQSDRLSAPRSRGMVSDDHPVDWGILHWDTDGGDFGFGHTSNKSKWIFL